MILDKEREHEVWVEVDLGRVRRNVRRLKASLRPGTKLLAVVKANAYGHGDAACAGAAAEAGADWLGVARVAEGASVRGAGIDRPVLLLAEPPASLAPRAVALGLVPTLYTLPMARVFSGAAAAAGRSVPVHVKVDTGMHRYGVAPEEAAAFLEAVRALPGLRLEGIWSHFAVAEDVLNPFTKQQHARFLDLLDELGPRAHGLVRHLSNSAGTLTFPEAHLDMVRCGIAVYGIHPSPELKDRLPLEPALSFKARVGLTKAVPGGDALSYGQRYRLAEAGTVATVPCGYADGLPRALTNRGEVLIRGRRYRISGTVTMDHFTVDCGRDEVAVGDEVVVIGRQGDGEVTAQEVAGWLGTIPYEVVCGINARVPRVYVEGGER